MNLINFLFLHFWSVVKYFHKKEKEKKKGKKGGKKIRQHGLTFDSLCFQKKMVDFSRFHVSAKKIAGWAESGLALNWQDSVGKCYNKVSLLFHWFFAFVEHAYHFIPPFVQGLPLFYCFERIFILFIKRIPGIFDLHRIILSLTLTCNFLFLPIPLYFY